MKGISLPINLVVIIAIAVLVLLAPPADAGEMDLLQPLERPRLDEVKHAPREPTGVALRAVLGGRVPARAPRAGNRNLAGKNSAARPPRGLPAGLDEGGSGAGIVPAPKPAGGRQFAGGGRGGPPRVARDTAARAGAVAGGAMSFSMRRPLPVISGAASCRPSPCKSRSSARRPARRRS